MKLVPIPSAMRVACKLTDKNLANHGCAPWWRVPHEKIPEQGILAVSTGNGTVKKGLNIFLIAGHDRKVFPDGCPVDGLKIHEFVGIVEHTGWQPLIQLGRDAEMVRG